MSDFDPSSSWVHFKVNFWDLQEKKDQGVWQIAQILPQSQKSKCLGIFERNDSPKGFRIPYIHVSTSPLLVNEIDKDTYFCVHDYVKHDKDSIVKTPT